MHSRCALAGGIRRRPAHDSPKKLGRIQQDWLRVADVLHLLCDLEPIREVLESDESDVIH